MLFWCHLVDKYIHTNLEVLIFVSMGEAHVSLQFACVEESLCTGHKLASA